MMDIFRLDDQSRTCKATGVKCTFQHVETEATAVFKTRCSNCEREHFIRIPIIHGSRPPIVPDKVMSTVCDECRSNVTSLKKKGKHICHLPPPGHPAHPECGEDL